MSAAKTLMQQLALHIGDSKAKRLELIAHCNAKLAKKIHPRSVHHWFSKGHLPSAETLIHVMRWMQLEGLIYSGTKETGLFFYTDMLPVKKTARVAKKHPKKRS